VKPSNLICATGLKNTVGSEIQRVNVAVRFDDGVAGSVLEKLRVRSTGKRSTTAKNLVVTRSFQKSVEDETVALTRKER
jgi:hypothetical protein